MFIYVSSFSRTALTLVFTALFLSLICTSAPAAEKAHGVAMNGVPKYKPGFTHFDYANPNAPKGGDVKQFAIGTYDSFNPFISKGVSADGMGLVFDTLTVKSDDEPFTQYGLVARYVEMPEDRSWVIFHIDPSARFHDGKSITAEDVVFTFNILTTEGEPLYRKYYEDVTKVQALDESRVKFSFKKGINPELPLILGQLVVLPKHFWKDKDFAASSLEIPLGSGPYTIKDFKAGRSVTYERVTDYWAKDHPVNKGRYNFNTITFDYYRDNTVALAAFKSGEYDFRLENTSKDWATAYDGPPFDRGVIQKEEIPNDLPKGMQGFVFNTRREIFKDRNVRYALAHAFDFEWSNEHLFYGQYTRTRSYFSNSELASRGLPSPKELALLNPLKGHLPPEVYTKVYEPPSTRGPGGIRKNLRQALGLLRGAGWEFKEKKLVNSETGEKFSFEILLASPAFERVVLPFKKNLSRLGIDVSIRLVDTSQYINRLRTFDFDMIVFVFGQSLSPGNEQRYYWHSSTADLPGSRNFIGIKNPAIDSLVELVIAAPTRDALVTRTRALDRALLWGHYVIPHWHADYFRVAYWNMFDRPEIQAKYDLGFYNWWVVPEQEAEIRNYRREVQKEE